MTVEQLSERSGIPVSVIWRMLTGTIAFDTEEIDAIAAALGVPVATFLRAE